MAAMGPKRRLAMAANVMILMLCTALVVDGAQKQDAMCGLYCGLHCDAKDESSVCTTSCKNTCLANPSSYPPPLVYCNAGCMISSCALEDSSSEKEEECEKTCSEICKRTYASSTSPSPSPRN